MRIAFVGVKRKYKELPPEYRSAFNMYHLELPYYYAKYGSNEVTITTVDYDAKDSLFDSWEDADVPTLHLQQEASYIVSREKFDVVIHWRKWFPELYKPDAINLLNCQDHSFTEGWLTDVQQAISSGKLSGILCFPTWHKENIHRETGIDKSLLFDGVTLGVDTDIYNVIEGKDPYQMLWASDPGRGVMGAVQTAISLWQKDRRFKLHVCYPDYVKGEFNLSHPAIVVHKNLKNDFRLWNLFNTSGILPYTSTFMEPSSRAHRQAMAAGSMVLYPPNMGTPSHLIKNGITGVVSQPKEWVETIFSHVQNGTWKLIGQAAREYAVSENWKVQAERFNKLAETLLEKKNAS